MTTLMRWAGACALVTGLVGALGAAVAAEPIDTGNMAGTTGPGETIATTLHAAVASLPMADERRDGYQREAFPHWVDVDRDGCHTRNEVLIAEAVVAPQVGTRCQITGGAWHSYYDGLTWEDSRRLDIDHMVPLAEAWDSGAHAWTTAERQAYANDLDEARALVAVSGSANRSKADRDPAEWLPHEEELTCRYITEWVVVKLRWSLTADDAEKAALTAQSQACEDAPISVVRAR
jgi:hypothetical protein